MEQNKMATTEAQKMATHKYNKAHTVQLNLRLNVVTDADIIEHMKSVTNIRAYVLSLIRKDMAEKK